MFEIKTGHSFDSAHFLSGYTGKCANIHGHRWKVEVYVKSEELSTEGPCRGMVVDFTALKKDVRNLIDYYDHALIIEEQSLRTKTMECLKEEGFRIIEVKFRPTAENFSRLFYNSICQMGYQVSCVQVFETPENCSTYRSDGE